MSDLPYDVILRKWAPDVELSVRDGDTRTVDAEYTLEYDDTADRWRIYHVFAGDRDLVAGFDDFYDAHRYWVDLPVCELSESDFE